jgi:hypothetical protein
MIWDGMTGQCRPPTQQEMICAQQGMMWDPSTGACLAHPMVPAHPGEQQLVPVTNGNRTARIIGWTAVAALAAAGAYWLAKDRGLI